jgi:hypothetical protein
MRFIFDLDHTLIDSSHRSLTRADGSLDLAHWRENCTRDAIMRDLPLPLMAHARRLHESAHCEVIACTARVMSGADYEYLAAYGILFDEILSRPNGDQSSDASLKERLLREYAFAIGEMNFYRFARRSIMVDDNENVLKHLQALGFRVYNAISINEALCA